MIADSLNIDLIQEFGLQDASDEVKQKLSQQFDELFASRLSVAVLARLSEEQKAEMDKVLDDPDGDLFAFYKAHIPEYELLAAEIIADIKKETLDMLNAAKELQGKVTQ